MALHTKFKNRLILFLSISFSQLSFAAEPASVNFSGFFFTPTISLEQTFTDNIYYQSENAIDSWITVISPKLEVKTLINSLTANVILLNNSGLYSYSSDDNYSDNSLNIEGSYEFNHRNEVQMKASYSQEHEDRGEGLTDGQQALSVDLPIQFDQTKVSANYIFGSTSSYGRLELGGKYFSKNHTNFTDFTKQFNYNQSIGETTFYWRLGGYTQLLVNAHVGAIDYKYDPPQANGSYDTLDRTFQKLLTGATWDVTGKTTGTIKLGYRRIKFEDSDRKDFSGPSWEVNITWSPSRYSSFQVNSLQEDRETTGNASVINYRESKIEWTNFWAERFKTELYMSTSHESFEDSEPYRVDKARSFGINVAYSMRRWLDFGLKFGHNNNDSKINIYDFERSLSSLYIDASL